MVGYPAPDCAVQISRETARSKPQPIGAPYFARRIGTSPGWAIYGHVDGLPHYIALALRPDPSIWKGWHRNFNGVPAWGWRTRRDAVEAARIYLNVAI